MSGNKSFREKKPVLYAGLILFLICAVSGLFLSLVHELTKDTIEEKINLTSIEAFKSVLPDGYDTLVKVDVPEQFVNIKEVYKSDGYGYCMKLIASGYKGDDIELALGINDVGVICGLEVISHSETPGLGSKITKASFLNQFIGKKAENGVVIVKAETGADNEIDAITGATKSSSGVVSAINQACEYYSIFLREEENESGKTE